MITIKTPEEINILREGGHQLADILQKVADAARPGISTLDLDRLAEELIFQYGGAPSFKGYKISDVRTPFPGSLCVSINDEVVHGIPRPDRILKEGDIVALDIGMWWPAGATTNSQQLTTYTKKKSGIGNRELEVALATDMAVTIGIGKISPEAKRLIQATKEALETGIQAVRAGGKIGDISHAIETHLRAHKLGVVEELAGHGVGYEVHEEPFIPNLGKPGTGPEIKEGMVLALEPISTLGDPRVKLQKDEWTFKTVDGSLSAHFEHTIAVTKEGAEILTLL